MYHNNAGIHRVFTVEGSELTNVLTQSAVLEVLGNNLAKFSDITSKSIHSLGLGLRHQVYTVSVLDNTWEAFRIMHEKNVSAVAVVDEQGSIIGNISSRDLRTKILDPVQFSTLSKPIADFFTKGECICLAFL